MFGVKLLPHLQYINEQGIHVYKNMPYEHRCVRPVYEQKKYIYNVKNSELVSRSNNGYSISVSFVRQC